MRSTPLKQILFFSVLLLTALHVHAEIYLTGYGGAMFGRSHLSPITIQNIYNQTGLTASFCVPAKKLSTRAIGGIKLGFWADNNCWLEHFGCYIDGCCHDLNYDHTIKQADLCYNTQATGSHAGKTDLSIRTTGRSGSLAFMVAYRPCTGDLQPYIALGPAVLFARQCPELIIGPHEIDDPNFSFTLTNSYTIRTAKISKSAAAVALDLGLSQMLTDCLSLDYSCNYRYAPCCFACDQLTFKHHYHLCSLQVGVGFNF